MKKIDLLKFSRLRSDQNVQTVEDLYHIKTHRRKWAVPYGVITTGEQYQLVKGKNSDDIRDNLNWEKIEGSFEDVLTSKTHGRRIGEWTVLEDEFVTLDTEQTIVAEKTFKANILFPEPEMQVVGILDNILLENIVGWNANYWNELELEITNLDNAVRSSASFKALIYALFDYLYQFNDPSYWTPYPLEEGSWGSFGWGYDVGTTNPFPDITVTVTIGGNPVSFLWVLSNFSFYDYDDDDWGRYVSISGTVKNMEGVFLTRAEINTLLSGYDPYGGTWNNHTDPLQHDPNDFVIDYHNTFQALFPYFFTVKNLPFPVDGGDAVNLDFLSTLVTEYYSLIRNRVSLYIPNISVLEDGVLKLPANADIVFINASSSDSTPHIIRKIQSDVVSVGECVIFWDAPYVILKKGAIVGIEEDIHYYGGNSEFTRFRYKNGLPTAEFQIEGGSSVIARMKRGLLYNGFVVNDPRGITPDGWRVPTLTEMEELLTFLGESLPLVVGGTGGLGESGKQLKGNHPNYFNWSGSDMHDDPYGFRALAAGGRNYTSNGNYSGSSYHLYLWTQTVNGIYTAWIGFMYDSDSYMHNWAYNEHGFSIRLIKETPDGWEQGDVVKDFDGNYYKTCKVGNQVWMAQNLAVRHFNNGDEIPYISNGATWVATHSSACVAYSNQLKYV